MRLPSRCQMGDVRSGAKLPFAQTRKGPVLPPKHRALRPPIMNAGGSALED